MKPLAIFLLTSSLFAADPAPDRAKQLADAKAEIAALSQSLAELQAWTNRLDLTLTSAMHACIGPMPQPPAPKPDPKPPEPKP